MGAVPGPAALGRGAVVAADQEPPPVFGTAPRVRIDAEVVGDTHAALDAAARLRRFWANRQPAVIELAVDPDVLKQPEADRRPPWQVGSHFMFPREQLRFLVWANTYDCRRGSPVWWHAVLAERAGAVGSSEADIALDGIGDVFVDGGPRGPVAGIDVPIVHADSVADGRLTLSASRASSDELAQDQMAAVTHRQGPARVIAPAGSGKTRVLAARLRHLIQDRSVDADHVTAVAYNNRAAAELRDRVGEIGARLKTLHALGWEIVRDARPGVRLIDEPEVRNAVERFARVRPQPNTDVLAPFIEGFEQVRVGLVSPAEVAASRPDAPGFVQVYERYRAWLVENNLADFDEQIYAAVEVLLTDPARRQVFQRSCRLMLVDEFQDLSPAFLLLVRLLAAPAGQVFGVGDDDQTIYGYRNASPAHLVDFDRWFPHTSHYQLQTNYRCPADVVEAAANLLTHNEHRLVKDIRAATSSPARGLVIRKVDGDELAQHALNWIQGLLKRRVVNSDIAVLCRVHAMLLPVQIALLEAGIAATSAVGLEMLERTGARAALAWLRAACATEGRLDGADVAEAIRRSPKKVRGETLRLLAARGHWSEGQIRSLAFDELQVWEGRELRAWLDDLRDVRAAARSGGTVDALRAIREALTSGLEELDTSTTARKDTSSHVDDVSALIQVASLQPDASAFEPWLRRLLSADEGSAPSGGRIRLATVHSTKGLEWDHVLVFGANKDLMPHRLATGDAAQAEEERRVFHVAITRGRREVMVLADRHSPSRYLEEIGRPQRAPVVAPASNVRRDRTSRKRAPKRIAAEGGKNYRAGSDVVIIPKVGETLRIVSNGVTGKVDAVDEHGALVRLSSGAVMRVRYGEAVERNGLRGTLTRP